MYTSFETMMGIAQIVPRTAINLSLVVVFIYLPIYKTDNLCDGQNHIESGALHKTRDYPISWVLSYP
jgi:hypothetical protein